LSAKKRGAKKTAITSASSPFTPEVLAEIFKTSPEVPDRLVSRESGRLEFKESYNWNSMPEYARTFGGFANAEGGFIVFGVADKPRRLKGLKTPAFEDEDPGRITEFLNDLLSPAVCWETTTYEISGKKFGLIHVHPATRKPVIATKSVDKIREGDIFYRYRGRTQRIRYAELRQILDEQRERERKDWLRHFLRVGKIGVDNAAVMDVATGLVTGPRGSFLIDESLLSKIKFIREGEFDEVSGAPALRVVGDVKPLKDGFVQPVRTVTRTKPVVIRTPDIFHAFLDREEVAEPAEYIKQLCFEPSSMLPVYCFMRQAGMKRDDVLELLKGVRSRGPAKDRLVARLKSGDKALPYPIPGPVSPSAIKRAGFRERLLAKDPLDGVPPADLRYAAQAVRSLTGGEIDPDFLLSLLKRWFDSYYTDREIDLAGDIRKAVCHVDKILCEIPG
jgi:hypothetical protein